MIKSIFNEVRIIWHGVTMSKKLRTSFSIATLISLVFSVCGFLQISPFINWSLSIILFPIWMWIGWVLILYILMRIEYK